MLLWIKNYTHCKLYSVCMIIVNSKPEETIDCRINQQLNTLNSVISKRSKTYIAIKENLQRT